MSTKIITAILGCTMLQYVKVFDLSKALLAGLYFFTVLYPNPPHAKDAFDEQYKKTSELYDQVLGGREDLRSEFETELKILWDMIGDLLLYVNMLYRGKADKLSKSGFPQSAEPVPNDVPGQLVIKKIKDGKEEHTAKITLVKGCGYGPNVKGRLKYKLQMAENEPTEANFKDVLETTSRFKIIKKGLLRGKEVYFRIAAWNSAGQGLWSDVVPFIPQ
jgi:hypothetical protein